MPLQPIAPPRERASYSRPHAKVGMIEKQTAYLKRLKKADNPVTLKTKGFPAIRIPPRTFPEERKT